MAIASKQRFFPTCYGPEYISGVSAGRNLPKSWSAPLGMDT